VLTDICALADQFLCVPKYQHSPWQCHWERGTARTEEVKPQLLVWHHPQVPFTYRGEDHHGGNRVEGEMLELDPVVVEDRPHEAARGRSEPVSMKLDEGHHVALWWAWLPMFRQRHDPLQPCRRGNVAEKPLPLQVPQPALHHDRRALVIGGDELHRHDHGTKDAAGKVRSFLVVSPLLALLPYDS